ncbi:base non-specific acid ribonuclease [Boletus edulis BED1]|uniref:ribonuclease T2 n=1 Tax=Boletus edulis BED1 TaxID=1328754 RepID=A0AAD4BMM6_BOLED|nr:base non-specific acid ribonuclease [Boletus edulis BED1]
MIAYLSLLAQIFGPPTSTTSTVDPSYFFNSISSGCSASSPISCQNSSVSDTCCTEYPGGLLLQTQFWDTNVPGSPPDSWTIHGLWPDNCDGTYIENCDPSRAYDIPNLLVEQGASATLDYMQQFWLNADGTNEHLWNHEWSTHGTCYSTLQPSCLPQGNPEGSEAVSYFQTIVQLFQTLPTYTWLANAGIEPSYHRTYTLSEILSALEQGSGGYTPQVGCSHGGLDAISWYYYLQGSLLDGQFVPINSPKESSCPHRDIRYLPKRG